MAGIGLRARRSEITVRDVIAASENLTFDVHCVSHPVEAERCAESHDCSIRPVWVLLQQRIDEVLRERAAERPADAGEPRCATRVGLRAARDSDVRAPRASRPAAVAGDAVRLFRSFRDNRTLLRRSAAYAASLMEEPSPADVDWLSTDATRGDVDHAQWELRYLRRALGILVAQRDALDDRTPSEVLRALLHRMQKDHNVDAELHDLAERQFNARLSAYRDAFTSQGQHSPRCASRRTCWPSPAARSVTDDPAVKRGAQLVSEYLATANAALQAAFGKVQLPEDVPPSKLAR